MLPRVLITDREALFSRYAAKLTGATAREKWPWWRKTLGFVQNGNVTEKEQFLADAVMRGACQAL